MNVRSDTNRNVITRKVTGIAANQSVPPVLFMLFNRASTTRKVFDKVRQTRPSKIFVAANGPRPEVSSDYRKCSDVREIFDEVDWDCEIHTNFRSTNIGMQRHWWSSLDWFFENVDSGIILEDDCVPDVSFFGYCKELLDKYKDDTNVMHINGSNFQFGQKRGDASYYISKYPYVWGWATWKRAWQRYDNDMSSFPAFKANRLIDSAVSTDAEKKYWMRFFESLFDGSREACDVKWVYTIWSHEGFCITPNVNMITNIGYGPSAGHTIIKERTMDQDAHDIGKIQHPNPLLIAPDLEADRLTFKILFHRNFFEKAIYTILLWISKKLK
jgi:hypothetical protein